MSPAADRFVAGCWELEPAIGALDRDDDHAGAALDVGVAERLAYQLRSSR